MRSAKGLLVLVDDRQALDEASAGLAHQVVATGLVVAIITMRTGTSPPPALTDLWKTGLRNESSSRNLSRREATELLVATLGGSVQDSSPPDLVRDVRQPALPA